MKQPGRGRVVLFDGVARGGLARSDDGDLILSQTAIFVRQLDDQALVVGHQAGVSEGLDSEVLQVSFDQGVVQDVYELVGGGGHGWGLSSWQIQ